MFVCVSLVYIFSSGERYIDSGVTRTRLPARPALGVSTWKLSFAKKCPVTIVYQAFIIIGKNVWLRFVIKTSKEWKKVTIR